MFIKLHNKTIEKYKDTLVEYNITKDSELLNLPIEIFYDIARTEFDNICYKEHNTDFNWEKWLVYFINKLKFFKLVDEF